MVEKILGKEQADDIFFSAMLTGLMNEKQASELADSLDKQAAFDWRKFLTGTGSAIVGGAKDVFSGISKTPGALGKLALIGAGTGVLGATAYDIIKDNVTNDDPKAELNAKIEAMYNSKLRELDDAKWIAKVRGMRDELKRGYKKMSTEEYAKKYNELIEALEERRA